MGPSPFVGDRLNINTWCAILIHRCESGSALDLFIISNNPDA